MGRGEGLLFQQVGIAAGLCLTLVVVCAWLIRRRMRRRGTGFFFYLEFVWLPLLILAGLGAAYLHFGTEALAEMTFGSLVVLWLLSFLVIGMWAIFLPLGYYLAFPIGLMAAAILAGVTLGNFLGIALEWQRQGRQGSGRG